MEMVYRLLVVLLCLAGLSLPACEQEELAWDEGFRDIRWETEDDDDDLGELDVYCRTLQMIRYRRVEDDLTISPTECCPCRSVELYRLLYGFYDHEFYEVVMFADARYRCKLERIFIEQLGKPTKRCGETSYWELEEIGAVIRPATQFHRKVEAKLFYRSLKDAYRADAQKLRLVWAEDCMPSAQ